jgi:hypothetical protein
MRAVSSLIHINDGKCGCRADHVGLSFSTWVSPTVMSSHLIPVCYFSGGQNFLWTDLVDQVLTADVSQVCSFLVVRQICAVPLVITMTSVRSTISSR